VTAIAGDYEARAAAKSDMQGHMRFLRDTAAAFTRPVIIELGVRSGNSTAAFLSGTAGNDGHVWSADIEPPDVPADWNGLPRWHFLQADDLSVQAQEWLPATCDILFVDTSHATSHTLAELRLYVPRIRAGGLALLHDTEWMPDGDRMLGEPGGPVTEALGIYCAETGRTWVNRHGSYGLGVVWA